MSHSITARVCDVIRSQTREDTVWRELALWLVRQTMLLVVLKLAHSEAPPSASGLAGKGCSVYLEVYSAKSTCD